MTVARIREFIGDLWGKTTTWIFGSGTLVIAYLQTAGAGIQAKYPWLEDFIFWGALVLLILHTIAPPPASVSVKKGDEMIVDHDLGTITIAKAADIPESLVSKAAGENS